MTTPLDAARAAWGKDLPDWVETLAIECGRSSQASVARALGRSGAVISQVLRRAYPAKTTLIEERIRGLYMGGTVMCPALGPLSTLACQDWRAKSAQFVVGNPLRVRMYRACLRCPRNAKEATE